MRKTNISINGKKFIISVPSEKDWGLVVKKLSPRFRPGLILAVQGDLGAGKTTFIQTLAKILGIKRFVPSPTFALMRSYRLPKAVSGICRLIHVDAYRIKNERELAVLDLNEELADGQSMLVIEWPERMPSWLKSHADSLIRLNIK